MKAKTSTQDGAITLTVYGAAEDYEKAILKAAGNQEVGSVMCKDGELVLQFKPKPLKRSADTQANPSEEYRSAIKAQRAVP